MNQPTSNTNPSLSILIVDDDEALAESLKELLEMEGYEPAVRHSGTDAIEAVAENHFDIALVDIRLPDMWGTELIQSLRHHSPRLESLIITGHATVEMASDMVGRKGIGAFLTKPVNQENLLMLLEQIGRRREAEEMARSTSELYRLVTENVADVIWLMDTDMRFVYASPSITPITGYDSGEMRGMHASQILTRESFEKASQAMYESIANAELPLESEEAFYRSRNIELEVICQDGSTLWAEHNIRPLAGPHDQFSLLLGISRDITERREARQALKHSEASLSEAQRIARVGSWEWDLASEVIYWSDEMYRILGYDPGGIIPTFQSFMHHVHPDDRELLETSINEAIHERVLYNVDHRILRRDGVERIVHEQGEVEYDDEGHPLRFVGTTHDVTELKQTEEKLRALSRRLLRLQEEERRAIGQDLHDEVGQSVTVLKLLLDKAVRTASPGVKETIAKAVSVTEEMVRQIREMSSELSPRMLQDLGLLPTLFWQVERLKERTGIAIDFRHGGLDMQIPEEVSLTAYRVVQEALTNATRHSGTEDILLDVRTENDILKIWVEDHGRGFDFASMRPEASNGIVGMEERVGLLGGNIEIDTSPNYGTTLWVTIPLDGTKAKGKVEYD